MTEGEMFNADARPGARVLEVGARLEKLAKQARRTPALTMLVEREKVSAARAALDEARIDLDGLLYDHAAVRVRLRRTDAGLSKEYLAIRDARAAERAAEKRVVDKDEEMTSDG